MAIFLLVFLICPIAPLSQEKPKIDYAPAFRIIETWIEAQIDYEKLPGISAAYIEDQEIAWIKGYGMSDVEKALKAGPHTIYSICSISKLFTSVAVMQLRDAGMLSLEDRIEDLLPWFNLEQKWKDSGPITVRSLLTHSSGLPRESEYPYWTGPDFPFPSEEQVKSRLGDQKTLYPASKYFQYSNLGLTLLGEIVAEVSGQSFDAYINEHILIPLRMTDTRTKMPESLWRGKLATGYSALKRDGTRGMLNLFQAKGIAPAAGFSSTAQDLARFASWQFRLLENGGEEILRASTLREMHRVHWVDPDWETHWGLGFSVRKVDGRSIVGHGGSCPGYRSTLSLDPLKKQAFVVMINAQGVNPSKYAEGMREILKKAENAKQDDIAEGVQLEDYAGIYDAQPWGGEDAVFPWFGKLAILGLPSADPSSFTILKHTQGDTFRRLRKDDELGEEVLFERDESGNVIRFWQHSNYQNKIK